MILFFRLGESCSHVGGLLYKIEMVVRLGGNNKSCTDDLCKWNHAEWKGVPPAPLSKVPLYNTKAKDKVASSGARNRRANPLPMTTDEKQNYLQRMVTCNKLPIGLSLFQFVKMFSMYFLFTLSHNISYCS